MLKILQQVSSSGTGREVNIGVAPMEPAVAVDAWNTAEVDFAPVVGQLARPLSAIAAMAVDLGPADLSTTFRKLRAQ